MTTTTLLAAPSPTAGGAHPRGGSRTSVSLVLAVAGGLATESAVHRPAAEPGGRVRRVVAGLHPGHEGRRRTV